MRRIIYAFLVMALFLSSCGDVLSDRNSNDACRYKAAKDLDEGKYDDVITSECADLLQLGAAYFGRAGFDMERAINVLIDATDVDNALDLFMTDLIGSVSEQDLSDLFMSKSTYKKVTVLSDYYQDAQFYFAVVQVMNGLSLIKKVIDSDGDGIYDNCDIDSTVIALNATESQSCGSPVCTWPTTDITFSGEGRPGIYRVLPITALCSDSRLLYLDPTFNTYRVAVTSGACLSDGGASAPCPVIINGEPLGLVAGFDEALTDSVNGLENAIDADVDSDVVYEIREIRDTACGSDACLEAEIADYISALSN